MICSLMDYLGISIAREVGFMIGQRFTDDYSIDSGNGRF